ncbi:AraC family transcriptional regulator [Stutzerimonas tarimensis]|uniref:AraC family transcriptional regulator n=1 Tax=Stutzerimonas tarimensis TaxID=1507735 RepID=A0ABV7T7N7_9GAMM
MNANSQIGYHDIHADHHDLTGAHSWMQNICGPHRLKVSAPSHIHFRHMGRVLRSSTLGYIEYGTDVTVGIEDANYLNSYSLSLPLQGEQEHRRKGELVYSDQDNGVIVSPHESQELAMTGECRKLQVAISRRAMRSTLESMLHRSADQPLHFETRMDAVNGPSGAWWRMVKHFLMEMQHTGELFSQPMLSTDMETLLIKGLILAQPNNYSAELNRTCQVRLPHYLIRAQEFIHAHAREELHLEDIEIAAGISRFKLFEGFKRHFGMAPMAYLKKYRLTAVRQEILEDRSARNISEIAMGWGFTHLGRFSTEYRKLFDETPSTTLQRNEARRNRAF